MNEIAFLSCMHEETLLNFPSFDKVHYFRKRIHLLRSFSIGLILFLGIQVVVKVFHFQVSLSSYWFSIDLMRSHNFWLILSLKCLT